MSVEDTSADAEITAMASIVQSLTPLDEDARQRILSWASQRFRVIVTRDLVPSVPKRELSSEVGQGETGSYGQIHELFDAANPTTGVDRVLVAAYWFQVCEHHDDLDSMTLNTALKNLGHGSANITRDLDSLIERTPHLVQQTRKEGSTKQARRKYKLTREGIRTVERMLNNEFAA